MSISHLAGQRHRVAGENSPNHQQSRRTDLETGAICGYKGKNADRLVTRIDPGVVSLAAELRGHERQAAEELEPWKTHPEERKVIDASPAAVRLAMISNQRPRPGRRRSPPSTRRAFPGKKRYAEDSLRVFVEQAGDMLEPGTAANSAPGRACKRSTRRRSPSRSPIRMTVTGLNRTSGYLGP
jgi:hypothetical protein